MRYSTKLHHLSFKVRSEKSFIVSIDPKMQRGAQNEYLAKSVNYIIHLREFDTKLMGSFIPSFHYFTNHLEPFATDRHPVTKSRVNVLPFQSLQWCFFLPFIPRL